MTDNEKEQLKQYILEHKEETQELFETIQALSKNQNAQELVMKIINKLNERGGMADLFGAEILEGFIEAAKNFDNQTENKPVKRVKNVIQKRAKSFRSPKDKVSDALFGALLNFDSSKFYTKQGDIKLGVGDINGENVRVLVQINIDELLKHNELSISRELTLFDRAVHDAVLSLNLYDNNVVNDNQIYRALVGYERHEARPAPQSLSKAIKESLHRLRYTSVRINATDEAQNFNYPNLKRMKRAVFEGYLLPLNSVEVEFNNGQISEAYEVLKLPPLYSYAGAKGQVINVDINVLALPETIEATPLAIVIRNYLIEQIDATKKSGNHRNNKILFDTLYKILDVADDSKNATVKSLKFRIRSIVEELLKAWEKPEIGFIAGHSQIIEGRKIAGVNIVVNTLDTTARKLLK